RATNVVIAEGADDTIGEQDVRGAVGRDRVGIGGHVLDVTDRDNRVARDRTRGVNHDYIVGLFAVAHFDAVDHNTVVHGVVGGIGRRRRIDVFGEHDVEAVGVTGSTRRDDGGGREVRKDTEVGDS